MTDKRIGLNVLVDTIGVDYFNQHKNTAVFSTEEINNGLFCFLGIDLHPSIKLNGLSASIDDWEIYALCYVKENKVTLDRCKLP